MIETGIGLPDLTGLYWFNIPGAVSIAARDRYYMLAVQRISGLPLDTPLFIQMANGYISELDLLNHTPDDISSLNKSGIHIYLYEPICSFYAKDIHRPSPQQQGAQFYTEFHSDVDLAELRAVELESIKNYATRNQLTGIVVHTCDYGIEQYTHYTPWMTLLCDDILLHSFTVYNTIDQTMTYDFTKKFICTNWRFTTTRAMVAAYLINMPAHLSWSFNVSMGALQDSLWFDMDIWKQKNSVLFDNIIANIEQLRNTAPIFLDKPIESAVPINGIHSYRYPEPEYFSPDNKTNSDLEKYYRDSFVSVVTESRFAQPTGNYSEKTYQAIIHRKPFILVAPAKTLQYVREEGFRTFGEFWDESYDDCLNNEDRLVKIFEVLDFINSKSIEELQYMYRAMAEIMEHNHQVLLDKTLLKCIKKIR